MFANLKELMIPQGDVIEIMCGTTLLWEKVIGLPSDYQEVEYIRADADVGAYLDLGFAFDTKAKIYLTQIVTDASVSTYPFGSAENSGKLRCMISCPYSSKAFCYGSNGSAYINSSTTIVSNSDNSGAENSFVMTIEPTKLHIKNETNGASPATQTSQTSYTMSSNLYLFAQNYNGSPRYGGERIISAFKYYDKNNELICDLVPCYRKSDGVIGMYDVVRQMFLTNVGTGEFTKGEDVITLPSEYQQVAYIQTDGNQYIDTGIKASDYQDGLEYIFKGCCTGRNTSKTNNYMFGCLASSKRSCNPSWLSDTNVAIMIGSTSGIVKRYNYVSVNTDFTFYAKGTSKSLSAVVVTYNDESFEQTSETTGNCDMPSANIFLLACNLNGSNTSSTSTGFKGRLYSFTMSDMNGNKLRHFVPCYRKSDNVIGLYDTVTEAFFTNSGSGAFTKGALVGMDGTIPLVFKEGITCEHTVGSAPTESVSAAYYISENASVEANTSYTITNSDNTDILTSGLMRLLELDKDGIVVKVTSIANASVGVSYTFTTSATTTQIKLRGYMTELPQVQQWIVVKS